MQVIESKAQELYECNCTVFIDDGDSVQVDFTAYKDKLTWADISKMYGIGFSECKFFVMGVSGNKYFWLTKLLTSKLISL